MKIAYFDCFSGISGDMCLGSLVDAGVSLRALEKELGKIPVTAYGLSSRKVRRAHLAACKVDVVDKSKTESRKIRLVKWSDVEALIHSSSISDDIKRKGLGIFRRIFEAEAKSHGEAFRSVHLHELGAVDCLIDVFGTLISLNMLGVNKIYSSPINLGSGFVTTATGILPVPAPATAHILRNVPVYSRMISTELATPTGAAIIKELSAGFGDIPPMDIEKIAVGAGNRDFENWPNVLRVFIGTVPAPPVAKGKAGALSHDTVTVIETNVDDMNPQIFEYVLERLFKAGALDAYITSIIMKKGRPAFKLTVLCSEERREPLIRLIFEETSTIGLRFYEAERKTLKREINTMDTEFGTLRVKSSSYGDKILKRTPEYEDCKRIAKKLKIPLIDIMKKIT